MYIYYLRPLVKSEYTISVPCYQARYPVWQLKTWVTYFCKMTLSAWNRMTKTLFMFLQWGLLRLCKDHLTFHVVLLTASWKSLWILQAYENQADRELRMIFEGQNFIHQTLRELSKRFDELLGRQELVLSKVTQMSAGGVAIPQAGVSVVKGWRYVGM